MQAVKDFHKVHPRARTKAGRAKIAVATIERVALIDKVYQGFVAEIPKGRCECCGRELMDEESVRRGIGPECTRKLETSARLLEAFGI